MFYLVKVPRLLQFIYPTCLWRIKTEEKKIYLTFDDGPHPSITPFVLEELQKVNASATFFCVGNNVEKYPDTFQQILAAGHSVGNHTFSHLDGWRTPDAQYLRDISKAAEFIDSRLFRPPYGRITRFQIKTLSGHHLQMRPVMWHILSGDFDPSIESDQCYLNVVRNTGNGSIIVFHDSEKAFPRLKESLPRVLQYFKERDFSFEKIDNPVRKEIN